MPASSNTQLSGLRLAKPAEFARKVRAAVEKAGSIPGAAETLGVTRRTLDRWLADAPELVEGLALPPPRAIARGATNPFAAAQPRRSVEAPLESVPSATERAVGEGVARYVAPALPTMPKLPAGLRVRVLVDRADGADLSAEELAAAAAAFPLDPLKKASE